MNNVVADKLRHIIPRAINKVDKRLIDIILNEIDLAHQHASAEEFRNDLDLFMGKPRAIYYPTMNIDSLHLKKRFDYFTTPHHILFHSKHSLVHFYLKLSSNLFARLDESKDDKDYIFTLYSHLFSGINGSSQVAAQLHYKRHTDYKGKPLLYAKILSEEVPRLFADFEKRL